MEERAVPFIITYLFIFEDVLEWFRVMEGNPTRGNVSHAEILVELIQILSLDSETGTERGYEPTECLGSLYGVFWSRNVRITASHNTSNVAMPCQSHIIVQQRKLCG